MKSRIHTSEVVSNKQPHMLADGIYYPAMIHSRGEVRPALFTREQIQVAVDRAAKNPEDVAAAKANGSWFRRLWRAFGSPA